MLWSWRRLGGLGVFVPLFLVLLQGVRARNQNNWAVIVDTSRFWYNYRHAANALSFYHTVRRLGIPDNRIILMLSEDIACNARNSQAGTVYNDASHNLNLYGESVEVDYRGDDVTVSNFIRLLTGRTSPHHPPSRRLLSDSHSNVLVFLTGHGGNQFLKFRDWEEISAQDVADAAAQTHQQQRYRKILWVTETCQASILHELFYSPRILALGSSAKDESSYSHHHDSSVGVSVIDRFTFWSLRFLDRLSPLSKETVAEWLQTLSFDRLHSHAVTREDLFLPSSVASTPVTDFVASASAFLPFSMRVDQGVVPLDKAARARVRTQSRIRARETAKSLTEVGAWGGLWNLADRDYDLACSWYVEQTAYSSSLYESDLCVYHHKGRAKGKGGNTRQKEWEAYNKVKSKDKSLPGHLAAYQEKVRLVWESDFYGELDNKFSSGSYNVDEDVVNFVSRVLLTCRLFLEEFASFALQSGGVEGSRRRLQADKTEDPLRWAQEKGLDLTSMYLCALLWFLSVLFAAFAVQISPRHQSFLRRFTVKRKTHSQAI